MITRINISIPEETLSMLRSVAPKGGISRFLVEALEEKIERDKKERALKELLAAPATFTDVKNSASWVRESRKLDEKRLMRLKI